MTPKKHVVFDVVGTCVGYQAFFDGVEKTIGSQLVAAGLSSQLFAFAWMESAEREFTYLSVSERYVPYLTVMKSLFYRILWMAGVKNPREFATDEQRDIMMKSYSDLTPREGLKETIELFRSSGFTVWCLTTGDITRVRGYFQKAGIDMPMENFLSCDTKGVAKPALAAYEPALSSLGKDDTKWFAAAHMWDVSAAKLVGFRGAYCTVYEKEPCSELFGGDMEVVADTLPEMAKKIIAASS